MVWQDWMLPIYAWERAPERDKRFASGDDYAGDAWRHIMTGEIRYVAVGQKPGL